ncbi:hypothetical protein CQW23_31409 [Capsicum baccatum]|uniref:Uncharacterized protein n=1 Tax=Capsicum baccatum TaxID=33114 RepID=A0A2G2V7S1_CAPBA|nr:hypothetical protein CQW23_31409 [Capsicum baccatum]
MTLNHSLVQKIGNAIKEVSRNKGSTWWYTPHMAAASRAITERIPLVDILFEVRDSRLLNFLQARVRELPKIGHGDQTITLILFGIPNVGKLSPANSLHQIGRISAAENGRLKHAVASPRPGETKNISGLKVLISYLVLSSSAFDQESCELEVMLKENGLDPMILSLLQRSSLDADREHRNSNPPVTDSNDVEDVLPNHISFSEELRLQGLGKWLQHCRVMLHHVAGTPERAWLLFSLIFILETVVVAIFRPKTIKLLNATHQQVLKKDKTINQLTNDLQECMKELGVVKEILPKVFQERNFMWEEVKSYREMNMLLNYEINMLKRKVDTLDEDFLMKEGQITILKDSIGKPFDLVASPDSLLE